MTLGCNMIHLRKTNRNSFSKVYIFALESFKLQSPNKLAHENFCTIFILNALFIFQFARSVVQFDKVQYSISNI